MWAKVVGEGELVKLVNHSLTTNKEINQASFPSKRCGYQLFQAWPQRFNVDERMQCRGESY
jgi:hypothetical protein